MRKGASQFITESDLPPMIPEDESGALGDELQNARKKQWVLNLFSTYVFLMLFLANLCG